MYLISPNVRKVSIMVPAQSPFQFFPAILYVCIMLHMVSPTRKTLHSPIWSRLWMYRCAIQNSPLPLCAFRYLHMRWMLGAVGNITCMPHSLWLRLRMMFSGMSCPGFGWMVGSAYHPFNRVIIPTSPFKDLVNHSIKPWENAPELIYLALWLQGQGICMQHLFGANVGQVVIPTSHPQQCWRCSVLVGGNHHLPIPVWWCSHLVKGVP